MVTPFWCSTLWGLAGRMSGDPWDPAFLAMKMCRTDFISKLPILMVLHLLVPVMATATEYRLVDLTPPGAQHSTLYGVSAGNYFNSQGLLHAAKWSGGASDYVDLNPGSSYRSEAFGSDGIHQVGYALDSQFISRAALWSGSAGSYVDLSGGTETVAYGVWGDSQVGMTGIDDVSQYRVGHALLWHGSADSVVDLNPVGSDQSVAYGVFGDYQVGEAAGQPVLWHGSADSAVNLASPGAGGIAHGIFRDQEVGWVGQSGPNVTGPRAALWNGATGGFQDLTPKGYTTSQAFATNGTEQVGVLGQSHAAVWYGNADQFVELSTLATGMELTYAYAIDSAGDVFGSGVAGTNGMHHALEWVAIHTPGDANDDGVVDFKDLLILSQNYGQFGSYRTGDFNNDWEVGFDDLLILAQHYGQTAAGATSTSPVPEPASIAALLLLPLAVRCRRR